MENNVILDSGEIQAEQSRFIYKVYGWLAFALALTGLVAYYAAQNTKLMDWVFSNWYGMLLVFGLQAVVVIFLTTRLNSMSSLAATISFILYSIISGFVYSSVFYVFTLGSLAPAFFISAVTFFIMGLYGHFTKNDVTSLSRLLMMTFIGLTIATAYNWYNESSMLYWITAYSAILLFTALVAYDTQKLREINIIGDEGTDDDKKEAVEGALCLYLDFIDILLVFAMLSRLFGKKKEPVVE